MNFGQEKYVFKKEARNLQTIGPLHFMILKLEESEDFEDRINLIRYYDRVVNKPIVSNSFPRYSSSFGARLRLSLNQ